MLLKYLFFEIHRNSMEILIFLKYQILPKYKIEVSKNYSLNLLDTKILEISFEDLV